MDASHPDSHKLQRNLVTCEQIDSTTSISLQRSVSEELPSAALTSAYSEKITSTHIGATNKQPPTTAYAVDDPSVVQSLAHVSTSSFHPSDGVAQDGLPRSSSRPPSISVARDEGHPTQKGHRYHFSKESASSETLNNIPLQTLSLETRCRGRTNHSVVTVIPASVIVQDPNTVAQMGSIGSSSSLWEVSEYIWPMMPSEVPRYKRDRIIEPVESEFVVRPAQKDYSFAGASKLPIGWEQLTHPEGQPFFYYAELVHMRLRISEVQLTSGIEDHHRDMD